MPLRLFALVLLLVWAAPVCAHCPSFVHTAARPQCRSSPVPICPRSVALNVLVAACLHLFAGPCSCLAFACARSCSFGFVCVCLCSSGFCSCSFGFVCARLCSFALWGVSFLGSPASHLCLYQIYG